MKSKAYFDYNFDMKVFEESLDDFKWLDELDAAYDYTAFTDANTQVKYTNNGQINTYLYIYRYW